MSPNTHLSSTPALIDNTLMSFAVVGIREDEAGGVELLRFDPHVRFQYQLKEYVAGKVGVRARLAVNEE